MHNKVREKMLKGERPLGTFFHSGGPVVAECLAAAGLDFIVIDTEHGPFDLESSIEYIRAAKMHGMSPFMRIKDHTRSSILKALDCGAEGIVVPFVDTVDQVKYLVECAKYYPLGRRGIVYARTSGYGSADFAQNPLEYFEICNRETLLLPQCETVGCLEHIEEIVNIPGVDGIFVGPYDLSIDMGIPAEFDNPRHVAAMDRILKACKDAGKFAFAYDGDPKTTRAMYDRGFDAVGFNIDTVVLINAYKKIIEEVGVSGNKATY